jgi:hypothetical protein
MPKHAASTPTPADVSSPSIYPADLTVALQAELSMLSAIDAGYAEKRQRLETWASPQEIKERLAREVEVCHKRDREPHVLRLGELHERIMNLTMFRGLHTTH